MIARLEVCRIDTDEVIHTVTLDPPLSPESSTLERVIGGMLINMHDDYYIKEVEDDS